MDWAEADKYLSMMAEAYSSIGNAVAFGLMFTILPLRDRFNKGERTEELWEAIFAVR